MPARSKIVTFRIADGPHAELEKRAAKMGQSPGGLAREMVLENLANQEAEKRGVLELQAQVQKLRSDLAIATEALLTVIGGTKESGQLAAGWVSRNLNQ